MHVLTLRRCQSDSQKFRLSDGYDNMTAYLFYRGKLRMSRNGNALHLEGVCSSKSKGLVGYSPV